MQPVYLDHAATSPLRSEARTALLPFLEGEYGNPSSRHPLGGVEQQRDQGVRGQRRWKRKKQWR